MTAIHEIDAHEPARAAGSARRKTLMDKVIETVATGTGNGIGWLAENGVLFVVFALIWIAFAASVIWSQGSIDQTWQTIRGLPLVLQAVVWLLFLPVMIGLWIWESTWPFIVRLILVIGIAGWNLLIFLPRALSAARP